MAWPTNPRPAKALMVLRRQINALAPNRSFANEGALLYGGMLGDEAHQATVSDHNPDTDGVVKATDITKDLAHGIDSRKLAQAILDSEDERVKYVIANGQIASGSGQNFPQGKWRNRNKGDDDHTEHCHISLKKEAKYFDDERPWALPGFIVEVDPNAPPPIDKPLLKKGSKGDDVRLVQQLLFVDGDFGKLTETAVKAFQKANGLVVDGQVGPYTWKALLRSSAVVDTDVINTAAITKLAADSSLAKVNWSGRGVAPLGYIKGMAVMFALVTRELAAGNPVAVEMARANSDDDSRDAISWYNSNFKAKGWSNAVDGQDTLRHLFVLMIGLGMRESSGRYCEGRDKSASNVSADTAEAGLFQMSWNSSVCSALIPQLLQLYQNTSDSTLAIFKEGVTPKSGDLDNFGSGIGATYQRVVKSSPAFAVEMAGVGLRNICKHWGPIIRKEAELRPEADELLKQVEQAIKPAIMVVKGKTTAAKITDNPPPKKIVVIADATVVKLEPPTTTANPLPPNLDEFVITAAKRMAEKDFGIMDNNSTIWALVRYAMIGVGMFLAGKGLFIKAEDVVPMVDQAMPIIGSTVASIGALWGLYVTFRTRSVPVAIVKKLDLPVVSPVTGSVTPSDTFTATGNVRK